MAVRDDHNKPFVRVGWSDDPKTGGLHWEDEMTIWDKPIQDMIDSLRDSAKMLGGAGFKDSKK